MDFVAARVISALVLCVCSIWGIGLLELTGSEKQREIKMPFLIGLFLGFIEALLLFGRLE